uniref:(California timema) hypothetical protein n=1 Tax=Timema californicum TaxID=61474 RepID=A0A7R9IWR8_TIMCA|nr:unnamed protein product [Timema californicum]
MKRELVASPYGATLRVRWNRVPGSLPFCLLVVSERVEQSRLGVCEIERRAQFGPESQAVLTDCSHLSIAAGLHPAVLIVRVQEMPGGLEGNVGPLHPLDRQRSTEVRPREVRRGVQRLGLVPAEVGKTLEMTASLNTEYKHHTLTFLEIKRDNQNTASLDNEISWSRSGSGLSSLGGYRACMDCGKKGPTRRIAINQHSSRTLSYPRWLLKTKRLLFCCQDVDQSLQHHLVHLKAKDTAPIQSMNKLSECRKTCSDLGPRFRRSSHSTEEQRVPFLSQVEGQVGALGVNPEHHPVVQFHHGVLSVQPLLHFTVTLCLDGSNPPHLLSAAFTASMGSLVGPANTATVMGDTRVQQRAWQNLPVRLISSYNSQSDGRFSTLAFWVCSLSTRIRLGYVPAQRAAFTTAQFSELVLRSRISPHPRALTNPRARS